MALHLIAQSENSASITLFMERPDQILSATESSVLASSFFVPYTRSCDA